MFYEGRVTSIFNIDKNEILSVLGVEKNEYFKHAKRNDGNPYRIGFYSSVLYVFEHNNKKYAFANDASSCEGIVELAILDFDKMIQIESLTIGWVKGNKLKAVLDCCDNPMTASPVLMTFDEKGKVLTQPKTYFTCACCGTQFKSTQKKQSQHDQDFGYGYCNNCE